MDARAARHLERSLAAVLHGRTVIAIAIAYQLFPRTPPTGWPSSRTA